MKRCGTEDWSFTICVGSGVYGKRRQGVGFGEHGDPQLITWYSDADGE